MEWTESHDVALCKEVLVQNPFLARKKKPSASCNLAEDS